MELQGIVIKDRNISVSFEKGRGPNSLSSTVDIEDPTNIFIGKVAEPVKEEVAVSAPQETVQQEPLPTIVEPEEPPFTPDPPVEEVVEAQEGSSAPSSDLPKTLFSRD